MMPSYNFSSAADRRGDATTFYFAALPSFGYQIEQINSTSSLGAIYIGLKRPILGADQQFTSWRSHHNGLESLCSLPAKEKRPISKRKRRKKKTFHDDCVSLKKNVRPPKISRSRNCLIGPSRGHQLRNVTRFPPAARLIIESTASTDIQL